MILTPPCHQDFRVTPVIHIVVNVIKKKTCLKTPTCLLIDDKEELISFGYEPEHKYSVIVIDRYQN
jgi:hypothetical protein